MNEDRERRIYRIVVISILIAGALGFLWWMTQDDRGLGEQGIFQFFSDPAHTPAPDQDRDPAQDTVSMPERTRAL